MAASVYSPLNEEAHEIRVVTLHPRSVSDIGIKCSLHRISIDDVDSRDESTELSYEAVSYTWGDLSQKYTIQVNNQDFAVNRNLWTMLHDLQAGGKERKEGRQLWIDAICINQNDVAEKGRQIPKMGKIYEKAERVLVWLGPGTRESEWGLDLLEHWQGLSYYWSGDIFPQDNSIMSYGPGGSKHRRVDSQTSLYLKQQKYWHAFGASVTSSPWWTRLWVVQEVAVAREVSVMFGSRDVDWEKLEIAIGIGKSQHPNFYAGGTSLFIHHFLERVEQLESVRNYYKEQRDSSVLSYLLMNFRAFKSALPQDKIYALLGMCPKYTSGENSEDHSSNYERDVKDTYKLFARLIMEKEGSLDYIHLAGEVDRMDDLPSWVPDLQAAKFPIPLFIKDELKLNSMEGSNDDDLEEEEEEEENEEGFFEISDDHSELVVSAIICDEIDKISKKNNLDEYNFKIDMSYLQECMEMVGDLKARYFTVDESRKATHGSDSEDEFDENDIYDDWNFLDGTLMNHDWDEHKGKCNRAAAFVRTMLANSQELRKKLGGRGDDILQNMDMDWSRDKRDSDGDDDDDNDKENEEQWDSIEDKYFSVAMKRIRYMLESVEISPGSWETRGMKRHRLDKKEVKSEMETQAFYLDKRLVVVNTLRMVHKYRRFTTTKSGHMGIVPAAAEPGDTICFLPSTQLPVVLRRLNDRSSDKSAYKFIGTCYYHGDPEFDSIGISEEHEFEEIIDKFKQLPKIRIV